MTAERLGPMGALADEQEEALAERRLRESEERYRSIVENSHDVIWAVDAAGTLTFISQSCVRIYGYQPEELLGRSFTEWVPPDQARADQEAFARSIANGEPTVDYDSRVVRKDGSIINLAANATILRNEKGEFAGVSGVSRDVTEQKRRQAAEQENVERQRRSDALVRMAGSAARVGGWAVDVQTQEMQWSDELYRILGLAPGAALPSPDDLGLYRPESREQVRQALHRCRVDGIPFDLEAQLQTPDRKVLSVRVLGEAERDASGAVRRIQGALQDITAHRVLERQLLRAQRMQSLGTLAGGIAHDLNNVLTPILLAIDFLRAPDSEADRAETLDLLESSARRGADMVRQVLAFARGVEGRRTLVRPAQLVREIVHLVQETFPRNVVVTCTAPEDVRRVEGDSTQLHQVLLNFAVNARDAMPEGGGDW